MPTNKKARPTIWMWLARYEKYLLNISNYRGMCRQSKPLTDFFERHPKLKHPENFSRINVEDYLIVLAREGASKTRIWDSRRAITNMWRWLIDTHDLPVVNIGLKAAPNTSGRPPKERPRLTLEEFERIYSEADNDTELRDYLEGLLYGERRETGRSYKTIQRRFKATVRRIGLPDVSIGAIKRELGRHLWAELLKRERTPEHLRTHALHLEEIVM